MQTMLNELSRLLSMQKGQQIKIWNEQAFANTNVHSTI